METKKYGREQIANLCQDLLAEKVVGFPTDTVYGLAISSYSSQAFSNLVEIKKRPITKPLSVMVGDICQIDSLALVDERRQRMLQAFLPGPVTFILKAKENLPYFMTLGQSTIGIRVPNHPISLAILNQVKIPLLVTSANLSNQEALLKAKDVYHLFHSQLASLIDVDSLGHQASTIIDLTNQKPIIIRKGPITEKEVLAVWEETK